MSEHAEIVKESSFEGEVKSPKGKIRKKRFNVKVIKLKRQGHLEPKNKDDSEPHSQQEKSDLEKLLVEGKLIKTPYDLNQLVALVEISNVLRECLDTMCINIEGFGHLFRPRLLTDENKNKYEKEIYNELADLDAFFDIICSEYSFPEARKRMRYDLESTGNGYFEIIRNLAGKISEVLHIPGHTVRLSKLDEDFTKYSVYVVVPSEQDGWVVESVIRKKRFRRFVQVDDTGQVISWFKEWGDPRIIDKRDGSVKDEKLNFQFRATELKHFKVYSPRTPYGVPRYIGRYVSILGSRRSEEVNYFTMGSNQVPSAFIMVEDGALTEGSVDRLKELVESGIGEDLNYAKFVLLEAETDEEEAITGMGGKARVKVEPMTKIQPEDQLFQKYDKNNQDKVRQAWRIPPIFVGRSEDYTRATAQASRTLADEQVFAPERGTVDHWVNQLIRQLNIRFHIFKSKTPNITDNSELIKAMGIAEKSGGMTPRRADVLLQDIFDGQVGPQPTGIDLDIPYSLQFAQAQNAGKIAQAQATQNEGVEREIDWVDEYLDSLLRGNLDE